MCSDVRSHHSGVELETRQQSRGLPPNCRRDSHDAQLVRLELLRVIVRDRALRVARREAIEICEEPPRQILGQTGLALPGSVRLKVWQKVPDTKTIASGGLLS